MVLCEQFVFTSSKIKDEGYQVTAKSSEITPEILKALEEYMYPMGIDPSKFHDSKSMIVLESKVAFIQSENIGIGHDGRPDTMYSHITIMNKDDFKKFGNDSRIFNEDHSKIKESRHLIALRIKHKKFEPDFMCVDVIGIVQLQKYLKFVFKNEKIAIINEKNQKLIQSVLSLLPPSLRLKSFSTLVPQPNVQTKFEIIQTSKQNDYLSNKFIILDVAKSKSIHKKNNTVLEICLEYLIEIIERKKKTELKLFHDEFESLPINNINNKIILIIGDLLLKTDKVVPLKKQISDNMLRIIGEIPPEISKKYCKQIRETLGPKDIRNMH